MPAAYKALSNRPPVLKYSQKVKARYNFHDFSIERSVLKGLD